MAGPISFRCGRREGFPEFARRLSVDFSECRYRPQRGGVVVVLKITAEEGHAGLRQRREINDPAVAHVEPPHLQAFEGRQVLNLARMAVELTEGERPQR